MKAAIVFVQVMLVLTPLVLSAADLTPPLFPLMGPCAAFVAFAAIMMLTVRGALANVNMTISILAAFVFCVFMYWILLGNTTVVRRDTRFQIGFGLAHWSLTKDAIDYVDKPENKPVTVHKLLLSKGAYDQQRIPIFWHHWSLWLATGLLASTLIAAIVLSVTLTRLIANRMLITELSKVSSSQQPDDWKKLAREKIEYLKRAWVIAYSADQKFALKKQIEEIEAMLEE